MNPELDALLEAAFRRVPPSGANTAIVDARAEAGDEYADALSYELVLPAGSEREVLVARALPRLVYFCECRGAKLPDCAGVLVTLFAGGELSFFHARDFVAAAARIAGLTVEQLRDLYGQHRTDIP